jgi:hypothetical protein
LVLIDKHDNNSKLNAIKIELRILFQTLFFENRLKITEMKKEKTSSGNLFKIVVNFKNLQALFRFYLNNKGKQVLKDFETTIQLIFLLKLE